MMASQDPVSFDGTVLRFAVPHVRELNLAASETVSVEELLRAVESSFGEKPKEIDFNQFFVCIVLSADGEPSIAVFRRPSAA